MDVSASIKVRRERRGEKEKECEWKSESWMSCFPFDFLLSHSLSLS
jgi:hypothetical protein